MRAPVAAVSPTALPQPAPPPAPRRHLLARRGWLAILCLLLGAAGCLWNSYDDVLRVHLDVLSSLADKAAGNAAAGTRPRSNDITELTYPLQRARQFVHQYRGYSERASYTAFVSALDRYQAFVDTIDSARGDEARWQAERPRVAAAFAAWQASAEAVRAALDSGS